MRKPYTDLLGRKLEKGEVVLATTIIVATDNPYAFNLRRHMNIGFGKTSRIVRLLRDAGVVSMTRVILRNEDAAINAALRQLKKGRK